MLPSGVLCVDRIAPTVQFTSPAAGNVSGTITISCTAADNDQVASVQFTLDGSNLGSAITVAPFSMTQDTHTLVNGAHTYGVIVKDREGNQVTSSVAVTVKNTPTVSLTAPGNGATISGTSTFTANVTGYGTGITVQFQRDGGNIGPAMTVGPYQYSYDTHAATNGAHTIGVVATDAQGNSTTQTVNVTVANVPVVNSLSPANGAHTSGTTTITANVTQYGASCTVQFFIDGNQVGGNQNGGNGNYSVNHDSHYLSGQTWHTYMVRVTDNLGNTASASNGVYCDNTTPASGQTLLGDWQLWDDGAGGYSSGRNYLPNYNDRDNWNWIWQNTGAKFGYVNLPGNPDPTHYQMYGQLVSSRCEGGAIGLIINGVEQAAQAPGQFNYQGGQTWSFGGGEQIGGRCWINGSADADEQANTFFEQGIGIGYWFGVKAGYNS